MEYKDLIQALKLKAHIDRLQRLKSSINPEVWAELEKHLELDREVENGKIH